jgi:D-alanyl-D-alanine carboxypeptidase
MTPTCAVARPHIVARAAGRLAAAMALALGLWLSPAPAAAQIGSDRYSAMVLDARNGNVLIAANADEQRHPASLTKMMTLYMAFEAIEKKRLSFDSPLKISMHAANQAPSRLGLQPGDNVTVRYQGLGSVSARFV